MCSSAQNKLEDTCGAYKRFDEEQNIAVECNSEESPMPGSFCMKITQQSPIGFVCKYHPYHLKNSYFYLHILLITTLKPSYLFSLLQVPW